jgi:hypothetical protein
MTEANNATVPTTLIVYLEAIPDGAYSAPTESPPTSPTVHLEATPDDEIPPCECVGGFNHGRYTLRCPQGCETCHEKKSAAFIPALHLIAQSPMMKVSVGWHFPCLY